MHAKRAFRFLAGTILLVTLYVVLDVAAFWLFQRGLEVAAPDAARPSLTR